MAPQAFCLRRWGPEPCSRDLANVPLKSRHLVSTPTARGGTGSSPNPPIVAATPQCPATWRRGHAGPRGSTLTYFFINPFRGHHWWLLRECREHSPAPRTQSNDPASASNPADLSGRDIRITPTQKERWDPRASVQAGCRGGEAGGVTWQSNTRLLSEGPEEGL